MYSFILFITVLLTIYRKDPNTSVHKIPMGEDDQMLSMVNGKFDNIRTRYKSDNTTASLIFF